MKPFNLESKLFWPLVIVCAMALVFAACGKSGKDEAGTGETAGQAAGPETAENDYSGWIEYISDPMGFTVMVPQTMAYSMEQKETAAGPTDLHYFLAEVGKETYGVICNDFSEDFAAKVDQKDFLDKGIKGFVDNLAGTVTSEREVTLSGHDGREIVLSGTSAGAALYGKARFFLIGSRLFQVAYIAEQGNEDVAAVDHFLDSFKLK